MLLFSPPIHPYTESRRLLHGSFSPWASAVSVCALSSLHGAPGKDWTVDELAQEVALSRSALAERFASLLGEPPMQYLTRWRLALAARMLREGREPIIRIAERSGYESEGAFSRAFKREFGVPPASWRRSAAR